MIDTARRVFLAHPETLAGEALGLLGLCVAIVAALYLPVLA